MKKYIVCSFIIFYSFLITACLSHKEMPAIETYALAPTNNNNSIIEPHGSLIRLIPLSINANFSTNFFIYRISTNRYLTDAYRRFLSPPNVEMTYYLQSHLTLNNATIISAESLSTANFLLQGNITSLYADYQNKQSPKAVISIQFVLYQCIHGSTLEIARFNALEETPIAPNNIASLMKAYEEDLKRISHRLSIKINQTLIKKSQQENLKH